MPISLPHTVISFWRPQGGPGVSLPPIPTFGAAFAAGAVVHSQSPLVIAGPAALTVPRLAVGWLGIVVGLLLFIWAMRTFAVAKTGIMLQHAATGVVAAGPYRWSRNPMYVGFVLTYAGLALVTNTLWPLVFLPMVIATVRILVIGREERYLTATFPETYRRYTTKVPRWL